MQDKVRPAGRLARYSETKSGGEDQYHDIYNCGYELRPRYHPNWEPSWIGLRKDFFSVEDGQPSIVSSHFSRVIIAHRSHYVSHALQWMLHADAMVSRSC